MPRLWYNYISTPETLSATLTSAEKQDRYRERHLGVDDARARIGSFSMPTTRAQLERLARYRRYTLTALIEDLVASAG